MIASVSSRRCGSYRMYLKGDSSHQTVMIVYELKCFFHISNCHNMQTLMQSCDVFHTQHVIFFSTFDTCASTMCLAITMNTCVNVCSLNCLELFFKNKIGQTCLVCVCFGSKCPSFLLLRDVFKSLKCCLDLCLRSMFDYIHICVFLSFEKLFSSDLDSFSIALVR